MNNTIQVLTRRAARPQPPPIHLHSRMILRSPPQQNTSITALLTDASNLTFILLHLTWSHGYPIFQSIFPFWPFIHWCSLGVDVTFVISIKWKYRIYLMTTDGVAFWAQGPTLDNVVGPISGCIMSNSWQIFVMNYGNHITLRHHDSRHLTGTMYVRPTISSKYRILCIFSPLHCMNRSVVSPKIVTI